MFLIEIKKPLKYFILTALCIRILNLTKTKTFSYGRPISRIAVLLNFVSQQVSTIISKNKHIHVCVTHAYRCEFWYVVCPATVPSSAPLIWYTEADGLLPIAHGLRLPRFTANPKLSALPQETGDLLFSSNFTKYKQIKRLFQNLIIICKH